MRRHHVRGFSSRLVLLCAIFGLTASPLSSQTAVAIATLTFFKAANSTTGAWFSRTSWERIAAPEHPFD